MRGRKGISRKTDFALISKEVPPDRTRCPKRVEGGEGGNVFPGEIEWL